MKIAFFVSLKETGGALNQTKGFISKINKIKFKSKDKLYIISDNKIGIDQLKFNNIEILYFKKNFINKIHFFLIGFLTNNEFFLFKFLNPFEIFLKKNKIDLLIFSNPSYYSNYCKNINYVINIWNTEIGNFKSFIEFKNSGYQYQKKIIQTSVENAFKLVVFTKQNQIDLINQFNCNPKNISIQNLSPFLPEKIKEFKNIDFYEIFSKFNFEKNKKWFFYPAQFWSHKNHVYLLNVMKILINHKNENIGFIFCGGDKGNSSYIKNRIIDLKLENNIQVLGHVSDEELISLYKHSEGLVNPTYLGRSSLPLLEAIYFNKKIFYSKNILDESLKPYVVEFDLTNPNDLVKKIIEYIENSQKVNLNYDEINSDLSFVETYKKIIDEFRLYLNTWKTD